MSFPDNLTCTFWRNIERCTFHQGNLECIRLHLMDRTSRTLLQDNLGCIPFHWTSMSCCTLPLNNPAGISQHHILHCTCLLSNFDCTVLNSTNMKYCILPRGNPGRTSRNWYWRCSLPRCNLGYTSPQMSYIPNGTLLQYNLGCIPLHLISMSCCTLLVCCNPAGISRHHMLNCTQLVSKFVCTVLNPTNKQYCILCCSKPARISRNHFWRCSLPRGNLGCTPLQMRYIPNCTLPRCKGHCIDLDWYILHQYRIGYHKLLNIQRQICLLIKGRMLEDFPCSLKATGSLKTLRRRQWW